MDSKKESRAISPPQTDRERLSHRLYAAMVLPLKENAEVDEPGLRRLVRYFVNHRFPTKLAPIAPIGGT